MTPTNGSVARRSRASTDQLNAMIDFFVENPGLVGGKFQQLHGKLEAKKKWMKLASKLNAIRGAVKSVEQWHTVWRDLKSRTCIRMRDRKRLKALNGNMPPDESPLTGLEKRVIALIGSNYIEDHKPENVSLEENLQLAIEDGDEIVLQGISATDIQFPETNRNFKRKLENEESDIQNKFLEIAQKQAEAMKMLAESNARQVEATLSMAQAITAMGEGLKACAEIFNKLANTIGNL